MRLFFMTHIATMILYNDDTSIDSSLWNFGATHEFQ